MRKRLISACIAAIIVFSIFGCAQTAEDAPATETETVATEYEKSESEEAAEAEYAEIESEETAVSGEEHAQGEAEMDFMSDDAKQDMFTYIIKNKSTVITGLQEEYENLLQQNIMYREYREIKIPHTLGGYLVTEIGDGAFEDIELISVDMPESIEVIGDSAFRNTVL